MITSVFEKSPSHYVFLRNIGRFEIRDAALSEIPDFSSRGNVSTSSLISALTNAGDLEAELQQIVQGNTPVERICQMKDALVCYCQCFATFEPFKENMSNCYALENIYDEDKEYHMLSTCSQKYVAQGMGNPFRMGKGHPVENALKAAKMSCDQGPYDIDSTSTFDDFMTNFKSHRAVSIEYLEPQYQRIVSSSFSMNEHVKGLKRPHGYSHSPGVTACKNPIISACSMKWPQHWSCYRITKTL
jgi:hypothetical protein